MVLRVKEVAHLVGNEIVLAEYPNISFTALLTNIEPVAEADGPAWEISTTIWGGKPPTPRQLKVSLNRFMSKAYYDKSLIEPIRFTSGDSVHFVIFKNWFFVPERNPRNAGEREEILLRVKKAVYKDEEELNALKSYIANVEATVEYERDGPQRIAISADVKLLVWTRDGGACVRCGSKEKLHFDHIIPVAKGGGNDPKNIQILCEPCNLKKSDKIAF